MLDLNLERAIKTWFSLPTNKMELTHDIKVHNIGTSSEHVLHLVSQSREISRKNAGSNQEVIGVIRRFPRHLKAVPSRIPHCAGPERSDSGHHGDDNDNHSLHLTFPDLIHSSSSA